MITGEDLHRMSAWPHGRPGEHGEMPVSWEDFAQRVAGCEHCPDGQRDYWRRWLGEHPGTAAWRHSDPQEACA